MGNRKIDYKQFEQERIISISDLIEEVLKKIWLILILAVVFAAACGGYKYKQDKEAYELLSATVKAEELQMEFSEEEMQEVEYILFLENDLEQQEQYGSDSILMQINPYEENRIKLQYMVRSSAGNTDNIVKAVIDYINQGSLASELAEDDPDIDCRFLSELVYANNGTGDTSGENTAGADSPDVFTVTVLQTDQAACEALASAVQSHLEGYLTARMDVLGEGQLLLLDDSFAEVIDSDLRDYQYEKRTGVATLKEQIGTLTEGLSDSQKQVLSSLLSNEEESSSLGSLQETEAPSVSKKYVGIGAVLGIILSIILIVLNYILRGTLNLAAEFQTAFDIPVWGQLSIRKSAVFVNVWRRIIKKKRLPLENEKLLVAANIKKYCRANDIREILLTGSGHGLTENVWISELKSALEAEGICIKSADDLPYSAETFEQLAAYSHVVLVETLHVSKYNDVVKEIQRCMEQDVRIAGAVVID